MDLSDIPDPNLSNDWEKEAAVQHELGVEAEAVLRLGLMLMGAGTAGYRVIRGMKRAARALGFNALDAIVGVNSITCTFKEGERFRTMVAVQQKPGIHASRIEALEDLTHHLHHRITVDDLNEALDFIEEHINQRFHPAALVAAAGVACAAFAVLNHYAWAEIPIVGVAAALGQWVRMVLTNKNFNQLGTVAVAGAVAALGYFAVTVGLDALGVLVTDSRNFAAGYVAAALFLIPGFPLFSSLLDLSRFDITAGVARMTYALSVIVTATISVGMVSAVTGLNPLPTVAAEPPPYWPLIAAIASFLGVAGFSMLFQSSRRMVVTAAAVGTVGNLLRLAMISHGIQHQYAAFVAGCVIGLVAAVFANTMRIPRITVTVPAAVIMIPGVAMYKSMYFLNSYDLDQAISNAADAALVVLFITAGLATARMMTDRNWTFGRLIDFDKPLRPEDDLPAHERHPRGTAGQRTLLGEVTFRMLGSSAQHLPLHRSKDSTQ
ncbi:threonine/serine exporter ThrE family protein [Corynebacterium choanae]|uniref:Inner membrane protein YjjP n=1 Tax=Corynebacterium choanae TaxID=1862358 RepID=A0A3G6J499_9CORY|nr:threonine/serine exporter family protein [Corynebacterium choanae]AZA12759.1 Inner membrane protein YjjP [Corynebacterium choanae]